MNVRSTLYTGNGLSMLSGKTAAAIFDLYEEVIEADLENLTSIQISLTNINGLRLSLNVCCKADLSNFARINNVLYEKDEDEEYQRLVFFPEGGAVK